MAPAPTRSAGLALEGVPGALDAATGAAEPTGVVLRGGSSPSMKPSLITSGVVPGVKYSGGGVRGQPGGLRWPSEQTAFPRASLIQLR